MQVRVWAMHLQCAALLLLMMYTCNGARARPRRRRKHLLRASIKDGQHGRAWYLLLSAGCARLLL